MAGKRWQFQIAQPGSAPGFAGHVGIRPDGSYSTSALAEKLAVGIHTKEVGIKPRQVLLALAEKLAVGIHTIHFSR